MSETKSEPKVRRTSELWNFFTLIDKKFATCNMCGSQMNHSSSTSNLRKHLKRKHGDCIHMGNPIAINGIPDMQLVDLAYEIEENVMDDEEIVEQEVEPAPPVKKIFKKYTNTTSTPKSTVPAFKKLKPNSNNNSEMIQEAITILSNVAHTSYTPDKEDDEFGQFGKYVTAQLRQLPLLNALEIQEKFYSILTRERINVMKSATEAHSYGLKSHIQVHQCSHEQRNRQDQRCLEQNEDKQQCQNKQQYIQQKPVMIQIENSCSLSEPLQTDIEICSSPSACNKSGSDFENQNLQI